MPIFLRATCKRRYRTTLTTHGKNLRRMNYLMLQIQRLEKSSRKCPLSPAEEVHQAADSCRCGSPRMATDTTCPTRSIPICLEESFRGELRRHRKNDHAGVWQRHLTRAKGEMRRAIENVEVACGIPTLMQGTNLEDIATGIDEFMIRQPGGCLCCNRSFQLSGHDYLLVFTLCHCLW